MGIPVSLTAGEVAALTGIVVVMAFIAAFVALFLCAIIGAGVAQVLYKTGSWSVKRVRESYASANAPRLEPYRVSHRNHL